MLQLQSLLKSIISYILSEISEESLSCKNNWLDIIQNFWACACFCYF